MIYLLFFISWMLSFKIGQATVNLQEGYYESLDIDVRIRHQNILIKWEDIHQKLRKNALKALPFYEYNCGNCHFTWIASGPDSQSLIIQDFLKEDAFPSKNLIFVTDDHLCPDFLNTFYGPYKACQDLKSEKEKSYLSNHFRLTQHLYEVGFAVTPRSISTSRDLSRLCYHPDQWLYIYLKRNLEEITLKVSNTVINPNYRLEILIIDIFMRNDMCALCKSSFRSLSFKYPIIIRFSSLLEYHFQARPVLRKKNLGEVSLSHESLKKSPLLFFTY